MSFQLFSDVLQALETEFPRICACVEAPALKTVNRVLVFRYEQQSVEQALVQKAARVLSGLHAAYVLLQAGHLQELRAIYRLLDEFSDEIVFLGEIVAAGETTKLQQQFLDDFWAEEFDVDGEPFLSKQKRNRVPRDKIQAAIARQTGFPVNPSDGQEVHRTLARTYSGYVHGASPHVMEMYGGTPEKFHTAGMLGTPPYATAMREAVNYFYRGLLMVIHVAILLECGDAENALREMKDKFEQATGAGQGDAAEKVKKHKKKRD